jgi:hypothetical protein
MKKTFTLSVLAILVALFSVSKSYSQAYEKGDKLFNLGLGLNSGTNIYGVLDYGIADKISVGAGVWYQSPSKTVSNSTLLLRGSYHFGEIANLDKLDLYGGANLGMGLSTGSSAIFGLHLGGRYYITEKIGINLELPFYLNTGGGAYSRVGATYKF